MFVIHGWLKIYQASRQSGSFKNKVFNSYHYRVSIYLYLIVNHHESRNKTTKIFWIVNFCLVTIIQRGPKRTNTFVQQFIAFLIFSLTTVGNTLFVLKLKSRLDHVAGGYKLPHPLTEKKKKYIIYCSFILCIR